MPSQPRDMPEQEHSIKARSHELFVEETPIGPGRASKPFKEFLRNTPAQPLSGGIKAIFWAVGIIVGVLFLVALWRASHRQGGGAPAARAPGQTVMLRDPPRSRPLASPRT